MELPGGAKNEGESPEDTIRRELLEKTGYTAEFYFVTRCLECGYSNTDRHCFVATHCKKVSEQQLDENEYVEVITMTLDDFRKHLRTALD
ncbi:hypothetical protein COX00_01620 [Candidatus Uhrbacteria bacterium CG22_combo_CG10-13_8_21_14_all_47_17]|uniref:Nudix hydrolase domain-containing protein n=1 Tax=Candidatus Uhrbacteria bacterium CG22_combo_CG10-13_8_21_14_all_47_17 TaxID=1975041 RepID=A0A2H0BUR9_9BACT|nr:MAG: hypothetical protein COX00_01620 [Candidatus Uhrbacteria bacterium CG22_combo_CG10-13_8_21_14_all_47_17]